MSEQKNKTWQTILRKEQVVAQLSRPNVSIFFGELLHNKKQGYKDNKLSLGHANT